MREEGVGGKTQCAALGLGPSGRGWVKWVEEGLVLFVWVPTGQCLQVRLLSGAFITKSSSSLESTENRDIYLGPKDVCITFD